MTYPDRMAHLRGPCPPSEQRWSFIFPSIMFEVEVLHATCSDAQLSGRPICVKKAQQSWRSVTKCQFGRPKFLFYNAASVTVLTVKAKRSLDIYSIYGTKHTTRHMGFLAVQFALSSHFIKSWLPCNFLQRNGLFRLFVRTECNR